MKNSNDTIGNRTRNLPVCSAVPQPTGPPRNPMGVGTVPINAIYQQTQAYEGNSQREYFTTIWF